MDVGLNETEKNVLDLLVENSNLTSDDLSKKIGVSKRTIERVFSSLQDKKMLKRIGSKRVGSWIVLK